MSIPPRTGQAPTDPDHDAFRRRFQERFADPAFDAERAAIDRLQTIAWHNLQASRKAPRTHPAGPGHADPGYQLSDEWSATRERLDAAQQRWGDPAAPSRVLLVCASARNDGSCPGEMSKTWRLTRHMQATLEAQGLACDLLDLSRVTSEYGLGIHPCKGCVSTAMPLCHWPCSCYPNHALGQTGDWMAEIYERWVAAHGVAIVAPTYWYQSPSPLKLMMDRLVCADGGNPDPSSTHGKRVEEARALELAGWEYPQHLAGRAYGLLVHGDVAGFEAQRRALEDWLNWMGLVRAGTQASIDRAVGYYEPYATSHQALDADAALHAEAATIAQALATAVARLRAGQLAPPDAALTRPRRK